MDGTHTDFLAIVEADELEIKRLQQKMKTYGPEMKKARSERKISLKTMAERMQCSTAYISQIENGKAKLNSNLAQKYTDALNQ